MPAAKLKERNTFEKQRRATHSASKDARQLALIDGQDKQQKLRDLAFTEKATHAENKKTSPKKENHPRNFLCFGSYKLWPTLNESLLIT